MNKLYGDTVTLYHPDAATGTVVRTVLHGVSWQHGIQQRPAADGTKQGHSLLLVVPQDAARYGADYTLTPGDRVCRGAGPAVSWQDWPGFVPAAVENLVTVEYVMVLFRRGKPHHVEAGTWWNNTGTGAHSLTR